MYGYKYHDMRTVMGRINAEKEIDRLRDLVRNFATSCGHTPEEIEAFLNQSQPHANDPRSRAG